MHINKAGLKPVCSVNRVYVNEHVSCFAYTLQLVIKDGFKQAGINKVLTKTSAIMMHVRKSIHASELLEREKHLQSANATW